MLILRSRDLLCILGFLLILFQTPEEIQAQSSSETDVEEIRELFYVEEFEKAIQMLQRVQEWACLVPEQRSVCLEAHIFLARIQLIQQAHLNTEQSVSFAMGLVSQYSISDPNPITRLYSIRAQLALEQGNRPEAGEWLGMASDLVEQETLTNDVLLSYLITNGNLKHEEGDYQSAILFYNQAIRIAENTTPPVMRNSYLMKAYHNRGTSYMKSGEISRAGTDFRRSLELARSNLKQESISIGYIYNSLGAIYHKQGDNNKAGSYFFMAASLFGKNSLFESLSAGALNNAAASYLKSGNYQRAEVLFQAALQTQARIFDDYHPELAVTYKNIATLKWLTGNRTEALDMYDNSIRIRRNYFGSTHPLLIESYRQLADFYAETGDQLQFSRLIDEALRITYQNFGSSHPHFQRIHTTAGRRYTEWGELALAEVHLQKAWRSLLGDENQIMPVSEEQIHFLKLSYPLDLVHLSVAMGDYLIIADDTKGDPELLSTASHYYELAMRAVDHLHLEYDLEDSRLQLQERYQGLYGKAVKVAYQLYVVTGEEYWAEKMLKINERGRARVARERVTESIMRQSGSLPKEIVAKQNELRGIITSFTKELEELEFESISEEETLLQVKSDLFAAKKRWEALSDRVQAEHPEYHTFRFESDPVERSVISSLLNDDELLISYMSDESTLYAIAVDQVAARAYKLGDRLLVREDVSTILNAIQHENESLFLTPALRLYEKLLQPILNSREGVQTLIVLSEGELHYLPFETLVTVENSLTHFHEMPYLIREYAVRYTPSATLFSLKQQSGTFRTRNILLVSPFEETMGSPDNYMAENRFLNQLLPLPLTGYETEQIAYLFTERRTFRELLTPHRVKRIRGSEATTEWFLAEDLSQFSYIHLATHAYVNAENPMDAGILFHSEADDPGILSLKEIYGLDLNSSLTVLSACETGLGKLYGGEGMVGLSRAFMYAGAAGLLVSGWKVRDQAAAELMTEFYKSLREGYTYTTSLQRAKQELISHPLYASPHNWAAFQLHGR